MDDDVVDELDLRGFCGQWLEYDCQCTEADLNGDGEVNLEDYAEFARGWVLCTDPGNGDCAVAVEEE